MENYQRYRSPYNWRYGSDRMREIWGEVNRRKKWRKIWIALAETQMGFGLVEEEQVRELRKHAETVDVTRSREVESRIKHDLMAELKVFAAQCPSARGILHMGATSMDVKDNATLLLIREAIPVLQNRLKTLLLALADRIEAHAAHPTLGFTHLQPAEPTTVGYRFALYAQDLWYNYRQLEEAARGLKGKGFTGAVGTSASFAHLLGEDNLDEFQSRLAEKLDISFFTVVNQTYPRQQEYTLISILAGVAAAINKFAFDLRFLQSPPLGEWSEPFGDDQVGSSAMPFKKNPIQAEKLNAISRLVAQYPRVAWDNAALSMLERTLDDSANRRSILPESFLMVDELLMVCGELVENLDLFPERMSRNMDAYAPFAATEPLLMALTKRGADRQDMHERLRQHAMDAWADVQKGAPNPLYELLSADKEIKNYLTEAELQEALDVSTYVGDAPRRARRMAGEIRAGLD